MPVPPPGNGAPFVDHYEDTIERLILSFVSVQPSLQVLGCTPESSASELKRAYHEKLREFHPDKRPESRGETGGRDGREQSAAEFAEARRREGNELYKEAQALSKMSGPDSLSAATAALTKYQAAIERYSEGISLAPQDGRMYHQLSIKSCAATSFASQDHRLRSNRALCYSALKDWAKCREDAATVVELKPDFMKGWFLLAKALWKEGNPVVAQRQLDAALQALPGCAELLALQDEMAADVQAAAGGDLLPPVQRSRSSRSVSPACTPVQGNSRSNSRVATPPPVRGASKSSTSASTRHRSSSRPRHRSTDWEETAKFGEADAERTAHFGDFDVSHSAYSQSGPGRSTSPIRPPAGPPPAPPGAPGAPAAPPPPPPREASHGRTKGSSLAGMAASSRLGVLWLLMAPPQNLSHHERDAIGNTPLHQAAAGGNLECAKCLMAQGCDVLAKNDRGHTPFALCTDPDVQQLLQNAMNATACKASGKQFSSTVLRYLCSWSLDVFCEKEITQTFVFEHPEATEKEKPVTWCNEVRTTIQELEHQLTNAMHLNQLETVTAALEAAADKPVDCKLVHQCNQLKDKLESEIQLGKAMQVTTITDLDEFDSVHDALSKAIDDAVAKKADPVRVQAAKTLRRKLLAEASLMRTVLGPQKTTVAHISMLQELLTAAKAESANEELVLQASKLIARLRSESEVQQRISATAVLCEVDCFKEAEGREEMPDWSRDTERFEEFHEDFKRVMEDAERDQISEVLMNTALEQLDKIERLLVEKKQTEEEMRLKAAKASKKKDFQWEAVSTRSAGLPAAMKKLLVTVVAALTPEVSSALIRQVALSEASGNGGLQPLDDDEREARDAEIEAERTVKEAEAALQERDEEPRRGKGQPLFATIAALRMEKGLPYKEFEPRCVKHMEEVSSSLADAYGDVQVKHLLTQECRLEAEFPRTVETGFDDVKECLKFADEFEAAEREDRSLKQFCKHFFEASDLPADRQAPPKETETAAKKTAGSSWWGRAYRAPNVMHESTQSKARARRGSTDKRSESAGKPKTPQAEEGTAKYRPGGGNSTAKHSKDSEEASEDSSENAEDTGEAAYETALRSGKSPEEAARIAAEAASKVAEDEARKSGKSPEEVQRAAAAAAYKSGVSNGMSKKDAEDASAEAAEDVSAKAARGIAGSSRGSDSGKGSAASTDTPATASKNEAQRDGPSGAVAPRWGWFQWLWNLLWPAKTEPSEKPLNNTLGPAKNKTTETGLQISDLERLDAILREQRDFDADGIVADTDQKEYTSACVVHLEKVGTAIDSSYSDQQAQEVLESQCLLDKERKQGKAS
eukprot:s5030_g6.t1